MSDKFWDEAWSLVDGCTPVSKACDNCWLARMSYKAQFQKNEKIRAANAGLTELRDGKPCFVGKVNFRSDRLDIPLGKGKPKVYAIWSDLYHEGLLTAEIVQAFEAMRRASQHTFLIITKRPERAAKINEFFKHEAEWCDIPYPDNIWHIVTAENQERADERIPHLLQIPGKRGIIIEPMLGPVKLVSMLPNAAIEGFYTQERTSGYIPNIHQVILGPENGPGKRPMKEEWAEAVEDQCRAAGVPFFRKDQDRGQLAWKTATA